MPIVTVEEFLSAKLDYLVIGGGTSGLVVAARLTEDPDVNVGVLEAGKYHAHDPRVNTPGLAGRIIFDPEFDWSFRTAPQKHLNNKVFPQSRGKGLGGSSLLNMLALVRPGKAELDAWEELGNPGWNWESTLEYMKKSERLQPAKMSAEDSVKYAASPKRENHGTQGPIARSTPSHLTEVHDAILDSLEALGVPRNLDSAGGITVGGLTTPASVDQTTATRSYAASGYYAPNALRPNLLVLTEAQVTKINLIQSNNGELQRATGVSFKYKDQLLEAKASKEVILAASTFLDPQLLELSGIGDRDILDSFGIETKIDLPGVGENLQDHSYIPTVVEVDPRIKTSDIFYDPIQMAEQQKLYEQQKGMLASSFVAVFGFLPANKLGTTDDLARWKSLSSVSGSSPEVFANTKPSVKKGVEKQYEILSHWIDSSDQAFSQLFCYNGRRVPAGATPDPSKRHLTILSGYTHPFSRGTVHIQSANPLEYPIIQQNYFSNEADIDIVVKTAKFVEELYKTSPLKDLIVRRIEPKGGETEEELRAWARTVLATTFHPVGTCAMLPKEMGGVVDSRLRVYGTKNLRVIDTSVIPLQVSCNIQTMAYAIGEKGADILKDVI